MKATNKIHFSELTTLGVGGPIGRFVEVIAPDEVRDFLAKREASEPLWVLGGGSNTLASDAGFAGTVLRVSDFRMKVELAGDAVKLHVGAGVEWDELVEFCVAERFGGLECLSGIPGRVGAAPIQNIGAYGQEVAERIESVEVVDRATAELRVLSAEECAFGYRDSAFKRQWRDQFVVTSVNFLLQRAGQPQLRYAELVEHLARRSSVSLREVRDAVLEIRARKSMVLSDTDPNRQSAGSFFTNPIVSRADADEVFSRARARDAALLQLPSWPAADGNTKLSAAWLIERAGFQKGFSFGRAGLSSKHCLAIINRGGASSRDILALASIIRRSVREAFGVTLVPEPELVGFDAELDSLLR